MAKDGMLANPMMKNADDGLGETVPRARELGRSDNGYPSFLSYTALQVFYRLGDTAFLGDMYPFLARNIAWFERNRASDDGLFFWSTVGESGYDNIPRLAQVPISDKKTDVTGYAAVDLCSQMFMYYRHMADMAGILGRTDDQLRFERKSRDMRRKIRTLLWDDRTGMFYDMNMRTGKGTGIKTIACFWPMMLGAASSRQAKAIVGHLANPKEFWSAMPVPLVAMDEKLFALDMWRGPVWVSQNMWVIKGLQRYGYRTLAAELATRTLDMIARVHRKYRRTFEFYNPFDERIERLRRKTKDTGPCLYYAGHNPIHEIAFAGLLGLAATADGLEIAPHLPVLPENFRSEFNFGTGKVRIKIKGKGKHRYVRINGRRAGTYAAGQKVILPYARLRRADVSVTFE